jgi:hypothetical protein
LPICQIPRPVKLMSELDEEILKEENEDENETAISSI